MNITWILNLPWPAIWGFTLLGTALAAGVFILVLRLEDWWPVHLAKGVLILSILTAGLLFGIDYRDQISTSVRLMFTAK